MIEIRTTEDIVCLLVGARILAIEKDSISTKPILNIGKIITHGPGMAKVRWSNGKSVWFSHGEFWNAGAAGGVTKHNFAASVNKWGAKLFSLSRLEQDYFKLFV